MTSLKSQAGVSVLQALVAMLLFAFFLTVVLRLAPTYMEGRSVQATVQSVVDSSNISMSLGEVQKKLTNAFITNQIEAITVKDVKVYREKRVIIIDASYEDRTPLFDGIDAVLMFDNLKFEIE
ncbi:DUF4845 domain-containing protein [Halieaceae bacterium IMCC14734]|uniref:DUF4845 domain-containing protein n=1 Tax=Candidatus Litorirhabdus singularis TaxID=2518993 RepID=A0ABT3THR9_9GAMM|nr:DUF4845 domain-containing protein [Candidatus Litorirhabdus singularis]MCX2981843.1 DUF4845 domain-containing protein [Candidatus Litorirhabdus singularis]